MADSGGIGPVGIGTGIPETLATTNPVTLDFRRRVVPMHSLSEQEVDALASGGNANGIYLTFFGICFGSFISLLCTVLSVDIADPKKNAVFVALTWLAGILSVLFFTLAVNGWIAIHQNVKHLKGAFKRP